jgi:hypothetical protein
MANQVQAGQCRSKRRVQVTIGTGNSQRCRTASMDLTIDRTLLYDYFQCFFLQLSLPVV